MCNINTYTINTSNSTIRIFFITCCLFAVFNNSEESLKCNSARFIQDKTKTVSIVSNIIHPSSSLLIRSHENSSLPERIISPKAHEEYLKNSQVKYMKQLDTNTLQRENSKLHKISKRSVLHKKFHKSRFKRNSLQLKPSYSFANLVGHGRRENIHKGRLKRNTIDSTSKDVSAFKGPMRISLLIDGLPPSAKEPIKREIKGVKTEAVQSKVKEDHMHTYHSKESVIYPEKNLPLKIYGQGKGLLTVKETAAAESLDLTKYAEEAQQPHVNIRRKRVYDILDKLFPVRRKRQIIPQNSDSRLYKLRINKSGADGVVVNEKKGQGTLSLPMFGYSYNRVEDDSALNAKFLFA